MNEERPVQPPPIEHSSGPESYERNPIGALLKAPSWLVQQLDEENHLVSRACHLLLWGLVFHAVFGVSMALFDGWAAARMAVVKAPLIALCSALLCLPSLYVFACVGGMPISLRQALALAATVIATTGLLLLGLAPVSWLFAVSTDNLAFTILLNLILWIIAIGFAISFFGKLRLRDSFRKTTGLSWWMLVYILVSLQMATTMRPLLMAPDDSWWTSQKRFFVAHFFQSVTETKKTARP